MLSQYIKEPVFLSIYKSDISNEPQVCFMPVKLIKSLKLKIGQVIYIKATYNLEILCKILPVTVYSNCGYQVLASCDVLLNKKCLPAHEKLFEKDKKFYVQEITSKCGSKIDQVDIVLILSTVEGVVNAKKNIERFLIYVKYLLCMYKVKTNCLIDCSMNSFAKKVSISYITVEDVKYFNNGDTSQLVGEITQDCKINIIKIDSEERQNFQVGKPVLLGGLTNILDYLKSLVHRQSELQVGNKELALGPPGVLLIGPPGCGKTSLVRQLSAQTQACLISTSGAELLSPFEGETLLNLSKIAQKSFLLSEEGPCIFFIDEIDSICSSREATSNLQELRLISQVLLTFDKCRKFPNLLLIAATNRPYALDQAARRSGRLEVELLLNIPTEDDRLSILEIHSAGILPTGHPSIATIAKATPGFVGADLKSLCNKVQDELNLSDNADLCNVELCMLRIAETITPSIHKSLDFITSKPKGTPIGGLCEVKRQLKNIFNQHYSFLDLQKRFRIKRPRGILLYGPQGCGKTSLVSSLASQKGYTFISANASHLLSPYLGDSEKRLAALFHSARLAQPSILFIDEIDGIFGSRDKSCSGVHLNLLTELLQAMDGADVGALSLQGASQIGNQIKEIQDGVLVCAATNHPTKLDSALLRPGRFDHVLYVPTPDQEARMDILKIMTSKLEIEGSDVTLNQVANETEGWTGAELENLISKVIIKSMLENSSFFESRQIEKLTLLKEVGKFSPSITEKDLNVYKEFQSKIQNLK